MQFFHQTPTGAPALTPRRRRSAVLSLTVGALVLTAAPLSANAAPDAPQPATELSDIREPSISAAGDSVVFTATTADGRRTVFHLDRSDGELTDLVTIPNERRAGDTVAATLSDDGCSVVAISQIGFDIFRDDDNNQRWDVYRLVLPRCDGRPNDWQLVSTNDRDLARDDIDPEQRLAITADGTIVAFTAPDERVDSSEPLTTVAVVDLTEPVGSDRRSIELPGRPAQAPTQAFHYRGADQPTLSGDGRIVAFRADFDPNRQTWNEGPIEGKAAATGVFVWTRSAQSSATSLGDDPGSDQAVREPATPAGGDASQPALSADGSTLAFVATTGAGCPAPCTEQIYRWEVGSDTPPTLVSAQPWSDPVDAGGSNGEGSPTPVPGDGPSRAPALNADGTMIAFLTDASNLTIAQPDRGGAVDDGTVMIAGTIADRSYLAPAVRPFGLEADEQTGEQADQQSGEQADQQTGDDGVSNGTVDGTDGRPDLSATGEVTVFDTPGDAALPPDGAPDQITAVGRRLGIALTPSRIDIAQLDFGSVQPNQQSAELYTSVRNLGPSSIRATGADTDSDEFTVTGGTCTLGVLVGPGESCTIRVVYTPTGEGRDSAELRLADETRTIATGQVWGQAGTPRLRIDPAGIDLGTVEFSESGQADRPDQSGEDDEGGDTGGITVTNVALEPTEIADVRLEGNHPADFSVVVDECSGVVLVPQQRCALRVVFTPTSVGYRSATIIARSPNGDTATAVVGANAVRTSALEPTVAEADPGARIDLRGVGFEPGTSVWAGIVGHRAVVGPFTVAEDGSVNAYVDLPTHGNDDVVRVALQGETSQMLTTTVAVHNNDVPTPSFLPGFGYG